MTTANLYRVIQPVNDIEAATVFYSRILNTAGERVSPGRHYFACGATILACYDPVADGDEAGSGWQHHENQYVYFAVADLEACLERVKNSNGEVTGNIADMPWGERLFYARDPFGNPISFVDDRTVFRG